MSSAAGAAGQPLDSGPPLASETAVAAPEQLTWPSPGRSHRGAGRLGRPLELAVYGRVPADAQWLSKLWRFCMYRVGVPTVHLDPCRLPNGPRPGGTSHKPHSGHTGTISIAVLVRRTRRNAMKPRIQRVLTQ